MDFWMEKHITFCQQTDRGQNSKTEEIIVIL